MLSAILVLLHPTSGYSEYNSTLKYTLRSLRYMWVGLLTDRINNKLEKSNLIDEHALNCEPVPLRWNKGSLRPSCWFFTIFLSFITAKGV